ncbi:MAG: hypothetical protein KGL95_01960, partial [Patescibacteria group bacterium]|nr:hypothetical protein [Patescibacteria group bacterium]
TARPGGEHVFPHFDRSAMQVPFDFPKPEGNTLVIPERYAPAGIRAIKALRVVAQRHSRDMLERYGDRLGIETEQLEQGFPEKGLKVSFKLANDPADVMGKFHKLLIFSHAIEENVDGIVDGILEKRLIAGYPETTRERLAQWFAEDNATWIFFPPHVGGL